MRIPLKSSLALAVGLLLGSAGGAVAGSMLTEPPPGTTFQSVEPVATDHWLDAVLSGQIDTGDGLLIVLAEHQPLRGLDDPGGDEAAPLLTALPAVMLERFDGTDSLY